VIEMPTEAPLRPAAHSPNPDGTPIGVKEAAQALRDGPIGAYVVAGVAVGLLFLGWLAFYFFLFMPRGSIG
jgi:hypothetical protein